MLFKLFERPKGVFETVRVKHEAEYHWYKACANAEESGTYAHIALRLQGSDEAEIHIEVLHWSPSVAKALDADWKQMLEIIKSWGIKEIYAPNFDGDDRWPKFIKRFGFEEPITFKVARLEV